MACSQRANVWLVRKKPFHKAGNQLSVASKMGDSLQNNAKSGILSLTIKDKAVLYAAFMPFLENGGLFIPTNKQYVIGDEVFMLLNLMDESAKIPVAGHVVWVTPKGAQSNRAAGIGVQFSAQDDTATKKIENYLAGILESDRPTHTL